MLLPRSDCDRLRTKRYKKLKTEKLSIAFLNDEMLRFLIYFEFAVSDKTFSDEIA